MTSEEQLQEAVVNSKEDFYHMLGMIKRAVDEGDYTNASIRCSQLQSNIVMMTLAQAILNDEVGR